jgi:hypothetical protein
MIAATTFTEGVDDGMEELVLSSIEGRGYVRGVWTLERILVRQRFRYVGEAPLYLLPRDAEQLRTRTIKGSTSISGWLFNDD